MLLYENLRSGTCRSSRGRQVAKVKKQRASDPGKPELGWNGRAPAPWRPQILMVCKIAAEVGSFSNCGLNYLAELDLLTKKASTAKDLLPIRLRLNGPIVSPRSLLNVSFRWRLNSEPTRPDNTKARTKPEYALFSFAKGRRHIYMPCFPPLCMCVSRMLGIMGCLLFGPGMEFGISSLLPCSSAANAMDTTALFNEAMFFF